MNIISKKLGFLMAIIVLVIYSSCNIFRQIGAKDNFTNENRIIKKEPFLYDTTNSISFKINQPTTNSNLYFNSTTALNKNVIEESEESIEPMPSNNVVSKNDLATTSDLYTKYQRLIGTDEIRIVNPYLLSEIDNWYGTEYKFGGNSKNGIDCSGLVKKIYQDVYKIALSGSSSDIFKTCKSIKFNDLKEGDLVFFKRKKRISHVGIYLTNNKFVHSSTSYGVIISDLRDGYWQKSLSKVGRILNDNLESQTSK